MPEDRGSLVPKQHNEGHDRWLAMQSAYLEYRQASDALESACASGDEMSVGVHTRMMLVEGQQRVTFERYFEARMGFLEFQIDQISRPDSTSGGVDTGAASAERSCEPRRVGFWYLPGGFKPVVEILAIVLVSATAFSLVREQKHVRDLQASSDELRTTLNQTRDGLQRLGRSMVLAATPAIQNSTDTPLAMDQREPVAAPDFGVRKPEIAWQEEHRADPQGQHKQAPGSRRQAPGTQKQSLAVAKSNHFSISLSTRFKRVGPIKVSLRSLNARQKAASISIVSGSLRLDLPHLKPHQPVSINLGHQQQIAELVIDRITGDRLDGHLVERRQDARALRASRIKPEPQVSP